MYKNVKAFMDTERDQFDNIIQIGIAVFENEELVKTYVSNVNTEIIVEERIETLTGITNQDLKEAPTKKEVIAQINKFVEDLEIEELICHTWGHENDYIKTFDTNKKNPLRISCKNIQKEVTKPLTKDHIREYSLEKVAKSLGIDFEQTHNALSDAIITGKVYFASKKPNLENKILTVAKKEREVMYKYWNEKSDIEKIEHTFEMTKNYKLKDNTSIYIDARTDKKKLALRLIKSAEKVNKANRGKNTPKGRIFFEEALRRFRSEYRLLRSIGRRENAFYKENEQEIKAVLQKAKQLIRHSYSFIFENNEKNHLLAEEIIDLKIKAYATDNAVVFKINEEFVETVKERIKTISLHIMSEESNEQKRKRIKEVFLKEEVHV